MKTFLTALISAALGGAVVYAFTHTDQTEVQEPEKREMAEVFDDIIEQQQNINDNFDNMLEEDFFSQEDPFAELRKMRKQMQERIRQFQADTFSEDVNPFDNWYSQRFGGGSIEDISQTEDADNVYYKIKISDLQSTSLETKVSDGMIHITGKVEKKSSENDSAQSFFSSSFQRSFPLPTNVDSDKMTMSNEGDVVILQFPKIKDESEAI